MARTHVVIRKSSVAPPSALVQLGGLAATSGLGALSRVATARRDPLGASSTATVGTLTTSPAGQPPVWSTVPTIQFIQGVSANRGVLQYVTDTDSLLITKNAVALPSGVTFNSALQRYEYDGVGGVGGTNGHILTANDTQAEVDWANMSASAVMAVRFNAASEVTNGSTNDSGLGNISYDTTRKFHGNGSLRMAVPGVGPENPGNWVRRLDDSFGLFSGTTNGGVDSQSNTGFTPPLTYEVAHCLYVSAALRNTVFPSDASWKSGMISHDSHTNQPFEQVWQHVNQEGYPYPYYRNPPNTTFAEVSISSPEFCTAASPDFRHQSLIDWGANRLTSLFPTNPDNGSAWSNCQKAWARYGGLFGYRNAGYPDAIPGTRIWKYWEQLGTVANPIGPILYPTDDWIWLKVRVDLNSYSAATNRIRYYVGRRYHTDWQLLWDVSSALLPTDSEYGYAKRINAFWFTLRTGQDNLGVNTSGNLGAVICRRDGGVIPFPQYWPGPQT